jgi:hypothetical protein
MKFELDIINNTSVETRWGNAIDFGLDSNPFSEGEDTENIESTVSSAFDRIQTVFASMSAELQSKHFEIYMKALQAEAVVDRAHQLKLEQLRADHEKEMLRLEQTMLHDLPQNNFKS